METGSLARSRVLPAVLAAIAGAIAVSAAHADDAKPPAATPQPAAPSAQTCALKGTYPGPKGAQIFDAASGGRAVAAFTGAIVPMTLSDFPADPTQGRARLVTSLGSGGFRIEGYLPASSIAVFTTRDVPVHAGHVWISDAQRVKLTSAQAGSLGIEVSVPGTAGQTVRANAPCDALALQHGQPTAMEVPGNGRGYMTKGASIDLHDEPNGSAVFTLKLLENTGQIFWSTESRAGFVHIRGRGVLTIDAWAKLKDLEPLKKGEMMDQFIPPTTAVNGAQLSIDKPPRLVAAPRDIPIRAHRDEKERPIGVVEAGAEVYLMETMSGWINVLPKGLTVTPSDDGGFWIPASEVSK